MCGLRFLLLFIVSVVLLPAVHGEPSSTAIPKEKRSAPPRVVPEKGVFLVAKRGMRDPRFQRTVVLLLLHGKDGTVGLIINRPTDIPVSRALPDLPVNGGGSHVLFFGGPVGMNMLLYLARSGDPLEQAAHVMADVYYGADRDTLEHLLGEERGTEELRMYVGHSGWGPGQLAVEIARGDWLLVHGDAQTVFERDLDSIWPELIEQRPSPGLIVDREEDRATVLRELRLARSTRLFAQ